MWVGVSVANPNTEMLRFVSFTPTYELHLEVTNCDLKSFTPTSRAAPDVNDETIEPGLADEPPLVGFIHTAIRGIP